MSDDEPGDDSSSNGESDESSQPPGNADDSESTEDERKTNSSDDVEAPGSSLLQWFQSLDRKERIVVVASSLAILNDSADAVSSAIDIVNDIESTESPSDSRNDPVYDLNGSNLSPADEYPRPDYEMPPQGTDDWHVSLNNNFNQIGRNIEFLSKEVIKLGEQTEEDSELLRKEIEFLNKKVEFLEERIDDIEN